METINVRDLPEPVAKAIAEFVDTLRREYQPEQTAPPPSMSTDSGRAEGSLRRYSRPGRVLGNLTREDIYDDVA
jgi:hypothetical protein